MPRWRRHPGAAAILLFHHDRNTSCHPAVRQCRSGAQCRFVDPQGRDLRHHRPQRRGQEHPGAHPEPAEPSHFRTYRPRWPGPDLAVVLPAARSAPWHRHDLPALQPALLAQRLRQHRAAAGTGRQEQVGDRRQGRTLAGAGRPDRPARSLSGTDLRRPEAARGHRPRFGQ